MNRVIKTYIAIIYFLVLVYSFNFESISQQKTEQDNLKVIVIGDTQHRGFWESLYWEFWGENNVDKTKMLFSEIAKRNPDMLIHLGDLTSDGSSKSAWQEFDEDNKPVLDKHLPYFPLFGNHEYFGNPVLAYLNFYSRFTNLTGKKWYSMVKNNLGIIMLNSNFDDLSPVDTALERLWYLKELETMENDKNIKYIMVCSHHSPFTNSTIVSPNEILRKDYVFHFKNLKKTSVFFSGHCHSYEKFFDDGKYFIVSGGGGGPRQKLNISIETRLYNDQFEGPQIRFFHFCEISITSKSLNIKIMRLNDDGQFSIADEINLY